MTLIAAHTINGVPVYLGDVLITAGAAESHCKKVNIISRNFVIGWTGYRVNALRVLRDLFARFEGADVSVQNVQAFLLSYDTSPFLGGDTETQLIMSGWVVDDTGSHCFVWNAQYNDHLDTLIYDESGNGFFHGSGADFYEGLLSRARLRNLKESLEVEDAVSTLAAIMGRLTLAEYTGEDLSWRDRFGFAYEAVFYYQGQFRYLDDMQFIRFDVVSTDEGENLEIVNQPPFFRYRSLGNMSLFQVSEFPEEGDVSQYLVTNGIPSLEEIRPNVEVLGAGT